MSKRIVLLGPPGAGKGTQATELCKHFSLTHISTGEIFRAEIAAKSALGVRAQQYMDKGELVPDELVIAMVENKLSDGSIKGGFLFDGFPRTVEQAKSLTEVLAKLQIPLTHVIELTVPEPELLKRIMARASSGSGRSDDNIEVAKDRLAVYHNQTAPVSDYYRSKGILKQIDGLGQIAEITKKVIEIAAV